MRAGTESRVAPLRLRAAATAVAGLACSLTLVACGTGGAADGPDTAAPSAPDRSSAAPSSSASASSAPSSSASAGRSPSSATPSGEPTQSATTLPEGNESLAGLIKAGETALAKVDDGTLISIEEERGGWEIQIADAKGDEYDVMVTADGGEMTSGPNLDRQDAEDRKENTDLVAGTKVDYREAAEAAAKEVPEGTVTELNLDSTDADRTVVWESDVVDTEGTKHELAIDASDASILEHDVDD